jgi:hypothetical protein
MPIDSAGSPDSPASAAVRTPIRDARPEWTDGSAFEPGVHDPARTFTPDQYRVAKKLADYGASVTATRRRPDGVRQPDAMIRWHADVHEMPAVFEELAPSSPAATIEQRIRYASQVFGGRRGQIVFLTAPPGVPAYTAHLGYHMAVTGGERAVDQIHFVTDREVFSVPYDMAQEGPYRLLDDAFAEDDDFD